MNTNEINEEMNIPMTEERSAAYVSWLFPLSFLLLIPTHVLAFWFSVACAGALIYKYVLH